MTMRPLAQVATTDPFENRSVQMLVRSERLEYQVAFLKALSEQRSTEQSQQTPFLDYCRKARSHTIRPISFHDQMMDEFRQKPPAIGELTIFATTNMQDKRMVHRADIVVDIRGCYSGFDHVCTIAMVAKSRATRMGLIADIDVEEGGPQTVRFMESRASSPKRWRPSAGDLVTERKTGMKGVVVEARTEESDRILCVVARCSVESPRGFTPASLHVLSETEIELRSGP